MPVNRKPARPTAPLAPQGGDSTVDAVYQAILLRIVRGDLRGGQPLKSTLLAQSLGTSRTPVVQALQRLAADGIVMLSPNKRAVVRPGAENWLVEVHELRELIEPHAAALAAQRIPDGALDELEQLAAKARPGRSPHWQQAAQRFDFALHLAIAEHSGNHVLGETIRKCWGFKRLSYAAGPEPPQVLQKAYAEHLAILDALKARDSKTASAAVLFHLRSAANLRSTRTIV